MVMEGSADAKKPGFEDRAFCVAGAENRNRTYDLRVTSALLYRLSYFGVSKKRGHKLEDAMPVSA